MEYYELIIENTDSEVNLTHDEVIQRISDLAAELSDGEAIEFAVVRED